MDNKINFTEDVEKSLRTLSIAFRDVPCNTFILKKFSGIPYDIKVPQERIDSLMKSLIELYLNHGGFILEVDDFAAVGVFSSPHSIIDMPSTSDPDFNAAFVEQGQYYRKKFLNGINYYYLFLLGKDFSARGKKGTIRSLFNVQKKKCDDENCALVLECINENSKAMYEYFGFKTYGIYEIGKNEVDPNGEVNHVGEGFKVYFMIYYKGIINGNL